jgi:hypothetical protein
MRERRSVEVHRSRKAEELKGFRIGTEIVEEEKDGTERSEEFRTEVGNEGVCRESLGSTEVKVLRSKRGESAL